jgi:hypothetical protein
MENEKVFIPNVNAVKLKSYRKRKNLKNNLKVAKVKTCKHSKQLDRVSGEIACTKCGVVLDMWFITPKEDKGQESNLIIWNRNYDKSRWTTYTLDILHGKSNGVFTEQLWLELCREVPDPFRWYDVYKVFQKYKLLKYWMAFGNFIGKPAKLNKEIVNFFNENVEMGHGKYCISYMFLLYKFTQMFGEEGAEQFIPLKYSQAWCRKTDHWWEFICLENGWDFQPTKVYKIKWDKEEFLKKFAHYVRDYITSTLKHVKNSSSFI